MNLNGLCEYLFEAVSIREKAQSSHSSRNLSKSLNLPGRPHLQHGVFVVCLPLEVIARFRFDQVCEIIVQVIKHYKNKVWILTV